MSVPVRLNCGLGDNLNSVFCFIETASKTILLLEDDKVQAKTIAAFLSKHGYEVTVCHEGSEAVRLAVSEGPDIMIADLVMKGMNGSEAVGLITSKPECSKISILFLTALVPQTDEDAVGMLKIGTNLFPSVSKATIGTQLLPAIEALA